MILNSFKKLNKKCLTKRICQGENTGVKPNRTQPVKQDLCPQGHKVSAAVTLRRLLLGPHRPCAVDGIFSALAGKVGVM
jgi:hypothetical protein